MNKYLVLFLAPTAVLDDWMKKPEAERESVEKKMREDWDAWMAAHTDLVKETFGAGKTKRVDPKGVTDSRNEIMLYSIVEAASHEDAAKAYETHPHLGIPESSIEVMAIRPM